MIQREWTGQDYIALLRRWRTLIIALAVAGGIIAYTISRFIPNRYKSQSLTLVQQPTVPDYLVRPVVSEDTNERLISMKQQLLSRTRLEPIIRQYGLYADDINRIPMDNLVARLRSAISVSPIQPLADSGSFRMPGFYVSVVWGDPRTAQEVCEAITAVFIQENIRRRQRGSEDTTQFMAQELSEAKAKLDEQDAKLADFQAHHMGSLPDDTQANFENLNGLFSQLDATTQAITRAQLDKSLAQSMLTQQIAARRASQTGKNPETFEEQLAALQTQLATLQSRYTDSYPDVVKTKIEIEAIKKKIAESDEDKIASDDTKKSQIEPVQFTQLRAQIRTDEQIIAEKTKQEQRIQEQIKAAQARAQATPAIALEYKALTRDYSTAREVYDDLLRKRSQSAMATELEHRQEGEQFTELDTANLPDKPYYPDRLLITLEGLGGGFALGVGLGFLLELRDTSLRSERDVEFSLSLPVLAMIPSIEDLSGKRVKQGVPQLVANSDFRVGGGA